MSDPFAPSIDPDIPTPTRADLLNLVHAENRDALEAGSVPAKVAETLWADARRQWDEGHKRDAERLRQEQRSVGTRVPGQRRSESEDERRQREQEEIEAEIVESMHPTHRAKYDDPATPEDRRNAIFQTYKDKLDERKRREEAAFRKKLARIAEAQDLLHRITNDPDKAHITLPADDSEEALLRWYDEVSQPICPIPFPDSFVEDIEQQGKGDKEPQQEDGTESKPDADERQPETKERVKGFEATRQPRRDQREPKQEKSAEHQPSHKPGVPPESHQRAIVASAIASSLGALALNVLNQKYGTLVPDWLILLLVYAATGFWLYAMWHIKRVQHVRLLLYTSYPRMFLALLIIGGAAIGAAAGGGLWLANRNEQRLRVSQKQPEPSSALRPESSSPSPTAAVSPFPGISDLSPSSNKSDEIPAAVLKQPGRSYWYHFMQTLIPLHKGFKTYRIVHPSGIGMCEFYVRLGRMESLLTGNVVVYVPHTHCASAIFASIANNYESVVEELKTAAKNDGLFDIEVQPKIFVYSDEGARMLLRAAETQKNLEFVIQTPSY